MNLHKQLLENAEQGKPVRVGLIGAGKFGSMYLAQVPHTPGVHLVGIADLNPANAYANLERIGWEAGRVEASSLDDAMFSGKTYVTDDWQSLVIHQGIDIIIECTGNPIAAVDHCLEAIKNGKHVINVTVEADAFCGPLLAHRAQKAGVIYSLAYGDQPALACELVDWARTCGFPIIAAGRGHKWLPHFRESTPDTVWDHWGVTAEQAKIGGMNPKMFNAFLDGSKPAIESTAIANATGLQVQTEGITFAPASIENIPTVMRLKEDGGVLSAKGVVDVVSSLNLDGSSVGYDIRKGVWVCVEAPTEYIRRCFKEYQVFTDPDGRCMVQYKKWHLIGLELGISVASVGLRNEATGVGQHFNADVIATAKRNLKAGEVLDGEGGYTVFGKLLPASNSLRLGSLPLGLAHNLKLRRDVPKDQTLTWEDVFIDETQSAYLIRKEMESLFKI